MTDLDILIRELKKRQSELRAAAYRRDGEYEDPYCKNGLSKVNQQLSVLRTLKENHSEISKKVLESQKLRKQIAGLARTMVDKIIHPQKHDDLTERMIMQPLDLFFNYQERIKQAQDKLTVVEEELDKIEAVGEESKFKPDFIYELTEALYDGELDYFEVMHAHDDVTTYYKSKLIVHRKEEEITLELTRRSRTSEVRKFDDSHNLILIDIGFKKVGENYLCNFDLETKLFDDLIAIIARALFEIMSAANKELEVSYTEYR